MLNRNSLYLATHQLYDISLSYNKADIKTLQNTAIIGKLIVYLLLDAYRELKQGNNTVLSQVYGLQRN